MFPSLTPSTQTSSGLFGVIGQGNNNGFASAPTSLFGVPAGGSGTSSSFTFGQPSSLAFGTPSFTSGFSQTSSFGTPFTTGFNQTTSSFSSPAAFGTPFTSGFNQTSSSSSSTPTTFGTPSFTGFNQTTSSSSTPTTFGTPSFSTGFSQTSSSTPTAFGIPSFSTGFSQTSSSTPTAFGIPSFSTGFSQTSSSAPTAFGIPSFSTGFSQTSSSTPTAFGTPFTTGFNQTTSSSSTPTSFGTPSFTGFSQTASSSSTPTSFGTPSFTGFNQTTSSFSTPTTFGTPSFTGFNQTSSTSTPTTFGTPSFTGFNQRSSSFSTPTTFGTPSFTGFNQTSSSFSTPTTFGTPSFTGFNQSSSNSTPTTFGPLSTTGTPSPPYAPTMVVETSAGDNSKFISISAMPAYCTKSHEELRWDNYMTGKTTAPFNPFSIKSTTSAFPPFSSSPANNISTTSWPSTTTSPTWNYSDPVAFTSSNTSNPFAINSLVKSTSSGFPPGSSLPVKTSWQTTTTSPTWISPGTTFPSLTSKPPHVSPSTNTTLTSDPSKSFNPFAPKTILTSPTTTFPFTSLSQNPFQIPSTSPQTQSSSPTFPSTTYPLKAAWPTSVDGPFPMVPAATNSVTVSPVSCELTSTHSQLSLSQITSTSAAASPFGILPPSPQLSFSRSAPIQYGISSIPVKDKPAPVRYPLLTTRHFSRGGKLPIRKYDPKLTGPKIPYYSVTSEMPDTFFVPRENPRALIITREKSPPTENKHEEKLSGSMYEKERDGISADTGSEDPINDQDLFATIFDVPSKLQQPEYYTQPQISELEAKERAEPGYCRRVKDFVVGRHGYGSIKFFGETDVRKLDLETLIQFNNREVIVYRDESKKPPVGEGLNIPAEITLLNIKCIDMKTGRQCVDGSKIDRYTGMLKKKAATQGAEFVSYKAAEGEWKFKVQHF